MLLIAENTFVLKFRSQSLSTDIYDCKYLYTTCEILKTFTTFLSEYDLFLNRLYRLKHSTHLCADFNIDLLKL